MGNRADRHELGEFGTALALALSTGGREVVESIPSGETDGGANPARFAGSAHALDGRVDEGGAMRIITSNIVTRKIQWRGDAGLTTAEYAVGTVAVAGLGGLLIKLLTSDAVRDLIWGIFTNAFQAIVA